MSEINLTDQSTSLSFLKNQDEWTVSIRKSDTNVTKTEQLELMNQNPGIFPPFSLEETEDFFIFTYPISKLHLDWHTAEKLGRHEKLRLLRNLCKLRSYLNSRIVLFMHPENLLFDENLIPQVIHRGIREVLPPFENDEAVFLKELKCLAIVLFSDGFSFDELMNGSLTKAKQTDFEKDLLKLNSLDELEDYLETAFITEQTMVQEQMTFVPFKRFNLYKRLSIVFAIAIVLLAGPLIYLGVVKIPYTDRLLEAHKHDLAEDNEEIITTLKEDDPDQLPRAAKFILARAYIEAERLGQEEKTTILKNISLKSDSSYLLYWIYNGKGNFEESIDLAKYLDDPQLIMYGLVKKIEQDKNDPSLSGEERDEAVEKSKTELEQLRSTYGVEPEDIQGNPEPNEEVEETKTDSKEEPKKQQKEKKSEKKD